MRFKSTQMLSKRTAETVVNAGDVPWANLHQRDGSAREENGEEEK